MLKRIYKKIQPQVYTTEFLFSISDQLSTTTVSDLIDEDIITFLPLRFLKTNRGTTKRRILERFQYQEKKLEQNMNLEK